MAKATMPKARRSRSNRGGPPIIERIRNLEKEAVYKFTLSTGKIILLREMKIEHQDMAARAAAAGGEENTLLLSMDMQKELLKILLVAVDGKKLTNSEKENLNALFNYREYSQALMALKKVLGEDDKGKFKMEVILSGEQ